MADLHSNQLLFAPARPGNRHDVRRRAAALMAMAGMLAGLAGCQDSFMDPSVTGRWEHTPTIVPVLDRIATIEDDDGQQFEYSEPLPEDLLAQAFVYTLTPGDSLEVILYDLITTDKADIYRVAVDAKGMIDLPQLGRLQVGGRTVEQAVALIQQAMTRLVANPLAQLTVLDQRGATYSIVGNVERGGTYTIPNAAYHLLEALTSGGRFEENVEDIYVIRRISLEDSESVPAANAGAATTPTTPVTPAQPAGTTPPKTNAPTADDLLKVIDEVTGPGAKGGSSPGMMGGGQPAVKAAPVKAAGKAAGKDASQEPAIDLPGDEPAKQPAAPAAKANQKAPAPAVDLVDSAGPAATTQAASAQPAAGQWVFLNGKWVQVAAKPAQNAADGGKAAGTPTMTQRVIRIPVQQLLSGKQQYNIVIRPGDVIRVPAPPAGLVYMAGQVARPGPINLPPNGGLTLLRALDASGGLASFAIPERIDLTRMIGRDRQATIRLDGRAISEQTQPDVYLKANDRINVGTNFWALPLAVVRNGFRANYGFGFLIDRNFGNDVFGPPPEAVRTN